MDVLVIDVGGSHVKLSVKNEDSRRFSSHGDLTAAELVENIPRVVPEGLGVRLDRSAWPRPPIFALVEERGRVARTEMDRVFNQGIGLVVIAAKERAREVEDAFAKRGEPIHEIGEVIPGSGVKIEG